YLSVAETCSIPAETSNQDDQYREAIAIFGHALDRLACAYEADPDTPMRFHAGHPSGPMAQFRKLSRTMFAANVGLSRCSQCRGFPRHATAEDEETLLCDSGWTSKS